MTAQPDQRAGGRKSRLSIWLDWFWALLAEELAPRPHRFKESLRMTVITTIGVGLMAACHVINPLGPYVVWLMLGPVAMMSPRTAAVYLIFTAPILAAAVPVAGILAESPWLMLSFIGAFTAASAYFINTRKLGSIGLVWQVLTLDTMYGVIFSPRDFGWSDSAVFGGCAIAFSLIAAFDTWIWPDPAEAMLLESLAGSLQRIRARFVQASAYYLDDPAAMRPAEPPISSEMQMQLELLNRASAEGISAHRHAVLLAALTLKERVHIRVDRLIIAARDEVPHGVRTMVRPEMQAACNAIAAALAQLASETRVMIRTGIDSPPSPIVAAARPAMEALNARVKAVRPLYIGHASGPEITNFGAVGETLDAIVNLIERPLDEPPAPGEMYEAALPTPENRSDPALVTHCLKVALCVVTGYVIGLLTQRSDLTTILTTIIVAGLPTYGATLRKAILRIIGSVLGGALSLLAIIIAAPNFASLPSYMLVTFVVIFISAYSSLSSGRVAYAGKQIGVTFLLVFAGLSPSPDVYSPLWRAWGILLGTIVVAVVFFLLWPVYAGDSLMPRLRKALRGTLSLLPGSAALAEIHRINGEITQVLTEILAVADDARMEGRGSLINHDAVVQSAGTIRRIAHRLASIAVWRLTDPPPRLDDVTEAAADAAFSAIRRRLESWLGFYQGDESLSAAAADALADAHSRNEIAQPIEEFISRIEAQGFARISGWSFEQRRRMLEELQSLRRLDFLIFELDTYLPRIPGVSPPAVLAYAPAVAAQPPA
jgi:Fusaric acid resistance protein family